MDEMLQLAVDEGREILAADCCLVTVAAGGAPRAAEAISHAEPPAEWTFTRWLDLPGIYQLLEETEGLIRLTGEHQAMSPLLETTSAQSIRSWLAVSLTALDGTQIGALQTFDKQPAAFTNEDEAALVHLAQMISATVERMRLYRQATTTRT
jgi:GAF domain-containing protein